MRRGYVQRSRETPSKQTTIDCSRSVRYSTQKHRQPPWPEEGHVILGSGCFVVFVLDIFGGILYGLFKARVVHDCRAGGGIRWEGGLEETDLVYMVKLEELNSCENYEARRRVFVESGLRTWDQRNKE